MTYFPTAADRVFDLCLTITSRKNATRLWNHIDHQPDPEPLWQIMLDMLPWAFARRGSVNSIILEYDVRNTRPFSHDRIWYAANYSAKHGDVTVAQLLGMDPLPPRRFAFDPRCDT